MHGNIKKKRALRSLLFVLVQAFIFKAKLHSGLLGINLLDQHLLVCSELAQSCSRQGLLRMQCA